MTKSELINVLRCVECGGRIAEVPGSDDLTCLKCETTYGATDGVLRMLSRAARADGTRQRTSNSFAYEWSAFGGMRPEWEQNFRDYLRPVTPEQLKGELILDVGAGSGRHSFHAAQAGASVVALDGGPAIDVARRNLPAEVATVQADADALPFTPGTFDVVMCIGVLHHLADPPSTLRSLTEIVRPGGRVHIYVYWQPPTRWHQTLLRLVSQIRRVTTRLPHPILHAFCYPIAVLLNTAFVGPYRALRHRPRSRRFAEALPLRTYADYPLGVLVNDQFDRFSAPIERRYRADEVREMMHDAGLTEIIVVPNHGWVAHGIRPAAGSIDPA